MDLRFSVLRRSCNQGEIDGIRRARSLASFGDAIHLIRTHTQVETLTSTHFNRPSGAEGCRPGGTIHDSRGIYPTVWGTPVFVASRRLKVKGGHPTLQPSRRDENVGHGQQRGLKPPPTIEPSLRDDTAPDSKTTKCLHSAGQRPRSWIQKKSKFPTAQPY